VGHQRSQSDHCHDPQHYYLALLKWSPFIWGGGKMYLKLAVQAEPFSYIKLCERKS